MAFFSGFYGSDVKESELCRDTETYEKLSTQIYNNCFKGITNEKQVEEDFKLLSCLVKEQIPELKIIWSNSFEDTVYIIKCLNTLKKYKNKLQLSAIQDTRLNKLLYNKQKLNISKLQVILTDKYASPILNDYMVKCSSICREKFVLLDYVDYNKVVFCLSHSNEFMNKFKYHHGYGSESVRLVTDDILYTYNKILSNLIYYVWYGNIFIAIKNPVIKFDSYHRFHCEDGPSIIFKDGTKIFALEGIIVPEEYVVCSDKNKLLDYFVKEKNTEIRRLLLKRVGIDTFLKSEKCSCIDRNKQGYELFRFTRTTRENYKLLKMINPSTGEVHCEWVPRDIKQIEKAIQWRNDAIGPPLIIT